jgi:hypothetical protein
MPSDPAPEDTPAAPPSPDAPFDGHVPAPPWIHGCFALAVVLFCIHSVGHFCIGGHLAHDSDYLGYSLDVVMVLCWGVCMLHVARTPRLANWAFHFSVLVSVGLLIPLIGVLLLIFPWKCWRNRTASLVA